MKRNSACILTLLFLPVAAFAASSDVGNPLNFTPPPSDISVVFLGNIFGSVDGILHGSGSQILGEMFRIFNAAVLSLGGIVFLYTTTIGVLNTAHEGQVLGQKYSTVWVPIKLTAGIGLLLPKASGYCYMQIFVMWVVVQGVGAADKVWDAALGYLQRGGVIVQAQLPPPPPTNPSSGNSLTKAATNMLEGQVCMAALAKILGDARTNFKDLASGSNPEGPCTEQNMIKYPIFREFCGGPVQNFLNSVNIIAEQQKVLDKQGTTVTVPMPNFDDSQEPYNLLNGVCGKISFQTLVTDLNTLEKVTGESTSSVGEGNTYYPPNLLASVSARGIAVQQMYNTLSIVASSMINNDPSFMTGNTSKKYSTTSYYPFGILETASGSECTSSNISQGCTNWGSPPAAAGQGLPALFNGTEFKGAISDYEAIMLPTLNAIDQADDSQVQKAKDFINGAKEKGWILAGAYFFNLAQLNQLQMSFSMPGNDTPPTVTSNVGNLPTQNDTSKCSDQSVPAVGQLCTMIAASTASGKPYLSGIGALIALIGSGSASSGGPQASPPDTVQKFVTNSSLITLPGQPGLQGPQFKFIYNPLSNVQAMQMPKQTIHGGFMDIPGQVATFFYNNIIRYLIQFLIDLVTPFINQLFFAIWAPMIYFASAMLGTAVQIVNIPGINPIIALANMGAYYINTIITTWIGLALFATFIGLIPILGFVAGFMMLVFLPVLMAFYGVMFGIGIMTAYYVPLVPYVLFTFGAFGWMIAVIEAMVAAPIVALGITHPQGEGPLGRGEPALWILLNVFLRPSLMVIGFIIGIILSYVGVWLINAGFQRAMDGMLSIKTQSVVMAAPTDSGYTTADAQTMSNIQSGVNAALLAMTGPAGAAAAAAGVGGTTTDSYTQWAGIFSYFFLIIIYTTMYIGVVQKAFTMIHLLPDRILRYLEGGRVESFGSETAQMGSEVQQQVQGGGQELGGQLGGMKGAPLSSPESGGDEGGGGGGEDQVDSSESTPDDSTTDVSE